MSLYVVILGWVATAVGMVRMYPQARTIASSRDVTGVSAWSVSLTVLSMVWWLIYCAAIADIPSSVSSAASAIAPAACLVLLARQSMVHRTHLVFIAAGSLLAFAVQLSVGVSIVGIVAAALSMAQAVPQLLRLLRTKNVTGLSESSWALTALNSIMWLLYGFYINSVPFMLPALVTIPTCVAIAVSMERFGDSDDNDGVLLGPRRRSFTLTIRR